MTETCGMTARGLRISMCTSLAETLSKHSMIGSVMSWSSSDLYGWIPTINGGAWVRSESWWTRSPNESTTGNFMMKQTSPQYTSPNLTSASQTNYAGILVCVSILNQKLHPASMKGAGCFS